MPARPSICIVEDDDSLRGALVSLLQSLGYAASGYESAERYLGRTDAASHACLITDIHLPQLSGIELARQLRDSGSETPVIMITARSEPMLDELALASGATCLLRKPFEADALIACLDRALHLDSA